MTKHIRISFIAASVLSLVCYLGFGSIPCAAGELEQARDQFNTGVERFSQGDYGGALTAFEESHRIRSKPELFYNIGMCQKALFHNVKAIATLEKYMAATDATANPQMRQNAIAAIKELKGLVGTLHLEGAPEGARVFLNGNAVGTAPLNSPLFLNPGQHGLEVKKDGYESHRTQVTVIPGANLTVGMALTKKEEQQTPSTVSDQPPTPEPAASSQSIQIAESTDMRAADKGISVSPLMIGGIVSAGLGLVSTAVGIYFSYEYVQDGKEGDRLAAEYRDEEKTTDQETANAILAEYNEKVKSQKENGKGLTASYVVGGALLATGVTLMLIDVFWKKTKNPEYSIQSSGTGIVVRF